MTFKKRAAALLGAAALVVPVAVPPATADPPSGSGYLAVAAHTCARGKHAVMPNGSHRCLARGQPCRHTRQWNRVYHRKGFHCGKRGRRGAYHLVYFSGSLFLP